MLDSADSFLISIAGIFIPAVLVTVFTFIYSWLYLRRYRKAISRLYKASFSGIDTERKRIANILHDHTGSHSILIKQELDSLASHADEEQTKIIESIKSRHQSFINASRQMVEDLYPKELMNENWIESFQKLSLHMSTVNTKVVFENDCRRTPPRTKLNHAYWVVQEKITNIIKHTGTTSIQLLTTEENQHFAISIVYKATPDARKWLKEIRRKSFGRGIFIIQDRLNIINADNDISICDNFIIDLIEIPYEDSNS